METSNAKLYNELCLTMDYDSGYMSHNPGSNLDSSFENCCEVRNTCSKSIYLSEDALLEMPQMKEIVKENYEETRKLFYLSEDSDVISDSESISDESVEIPLQKPLIFYSDNDKSALNNITNVFDGNFQKNRLTLIFSKCDKENIYTVKRKFNSLTPEKEQTERLNFDTNQTNSFNQDNESNLTCSSFNASLSKTDSLNEDNSTTEDPNLTCSSLHSHLSKIDSLNPDESIAGDPNLTCSSFNANLSNVDELSQVNPRNVSCSSFNENVNKTDPSTQNLACTSFNSNFIKTESSNPDNSTVGDPNLISLSFNSGPSNVDEELSQVDSSTRDLNVSCSNSDKIDPSTRNDDFNLTCTSFNPSLCKIDALSQNNSMTEDPNLICSSSKTNLNKIDPSTQNNDLNLICTSFNPSLSKIDALNQNNSTTDDPNLICSSSNTNLNRIDPSTQNSDLNLTCTSFNSNLSNIDSLNRNNSIIEDSNLTCSSFNASSSKFVELNKVNLSTRGLSMSCLSLNLNLKRPTPSSSSLIMTPQKRFVNAMNPDLSPDLFAEEEKLEEPKIIPPTKERYVTKTDYQLLSKVHESLKGVLPPRSMTVVKLTVDDMLNGIRSNEHLFWIKKECATNRSLIAKGIKTSNFEWPEGLQARWHGLHYNRSKLSERIESQCAKYCERYVGAETQSSCTVFEISNDSPLKRKQLNNRLSLKSPGRRLSHLAKRRITFSNLQSSSSFAGSRARQIMVDARKLELLKRKSPRKTPKKSPRVKTRTTPSSSAKKKLAASKRALFQSPERENKPGLFSYCSIDGKKQLTKRALFVSPTKKISPLKYSPFKRSPFKRLQTLNMLRKRKRSESEDGGGPSKMARNVTESDFSCSRSSFEAAQSGIRMRSNESIVSSGSNSELSANHKKKLQWAVYEALSTQNIKPDHRQFKIFASILARVTKRLLPSYSTFIGKEVGTSERMLRIAKNHVFNVVKGRSVEEIVGEFVRNKLKKDIKPQGYVGIEVNHNATKGFSNGIDRIRKVINFGEDEEK